MTDEEILGNGRVGDGVLGGGLSGDGLDGDVEDGRVPVGEALPGLSIHPFDQDESVVEAFLLVKLRADDGEESWSFRTTRAPNREELLGALMVQVEILRRSLVSEWE